MTTRVPGQVKPVQRDGKLGTRRERRDRNDRIVEAFDGDNYRELAAAWGLSLRTIYRIVNGR